MLWSAPKIVLTFVQLPVHGLQVFFVQFQFGIECASAPKDRVFNSQWMPLGVNRGMPDILC